MRPERVCLITGAGRGLGRGMARALAAQGWAIAANDIDAPTVDALQAELAGAGFTSLAAPGDVSRKPDVDRLVQATVAGLGRIDALINNAGILHTASVLELSVEGWERTLDVNLKGAFLVSQAVARHMVAHGIRGRIINIGSINGRAVRAHEVAYCVAKAGLVHLTRVFAVELARYGITVNTLSPGAVETEMLRAHFGNDPSAVEQIVRGDPERFRLGIPLGRLTSPADVEACVSFLLSPGAAHVTGQDLHVNGGQLM